MWKKLTICVDWGSDCWPWAHAWPPDPSDWKVGSCESWLKIREVTCSCLAKWLAPPLPWGRPPPIPGYFMPAGFCCCGWGIPAVTFPSSGTFGSWHLYISGYISSSSLMLSVSVQWRRLIWDFRLGFFPHLNPQIWQLYEFVGRVFPSPSIFTPSCFVSWCFFSVFWS